MKPLRAELKRRDGSVSPGPAHGRGNRAIEGNAVDALQSNAPRPETSSFVSQCGRGACAEGETAKRPQPRLPLPLPRPRLLSRPGDLHIKVVT